MGTSADLTELGKRVLIDKPSEQSLGEGALSALSRTEPRESNAAETTPSPGCLSWYFFLQQYAGTSPLDSQTPTKVLSSTGDCQN